MLTVLKMEFDSILPYETDFEIKRLVLTTIEESNQIKGNMKLYEEDFDASPTVIKGRIVEKLQRGLNDDFLIIGIDPGKRSGMSVQYYGKEIEISSFYSYNDLVSHVVQILGGLKASSKIVKVGNGNMYIAKKIINLINVSYCSHFEVELVDEQKTSVRSRYHNKRAERDKLSARYISQRNGNRKLVLPPSRE